MQFWARAATRLMAFAVTGTIAAALPAYAGDTLPDGKTVEDGKYEKNGEPIYNIKPDGTVDFYTYAGFRRYHADCHVCHGPDGMGSTYAPALAESLKKLSYDDFREVIVNGRKAKAGAAAAESVMPSFGTNRNVICYLDDLYVYLKSRADGALQRGRPEKREDKPKSYIAAEEACLNAGK
jgi:methanol metabolism-related c-type cytochrome